ncbi:uncharacterized protein [Drosophila kikkawai]|uniref:DUF5641 domain-containing protein n=1 Tax=Drosophila kikkawai TaxID=30033 RepID=A0ABM4GQN8_DROKI
MSDTENSVRAPNESPSDVDFYRAKADSILRQINSMKFYLNGDSVNQFDEADLLARMDWINSLNEAFDAAQTSLERLDFTEISSDHRMEFSGVFMDVKAKLSRGLAAHRKSQLPASIAANSTSIDMTNNPELSSRSRKPRLPNLEIARFHGSYAEWPDFLATFTTVIGNDDELTDIKKLQYLRLSLGGVALETIRSLEPSHANYHKAMNLLINRFDNKVLHFQAHVQAIFGSKGVEKGSSKGLRELSDCMNSRLRAIRTLATTQQILDGLLIHIVTRKLDHGTREKWEEDLSITELPTWDAMESFLEKRCRMMENLDQAWSLEGYRGCPTLLIEEACIEEVIPGGDGVIRVAMVRTATGLIKRAVAKLAALPIDSEIVGTVPLPTGGVCSEQTAST